MPETVKRMNLGIALIKVMACLGVVSLHFGGKAYGRRLAVPAFMFIAVYLSAKTILSGDGEKLRKRLGRLFVPYATWAVIGYIIQVLTGYSNSPMDIVWQLLTGYPTCGHMYYITLLFWFTVLLFLIEKFLRRFSTGICIGFVALSFLMQYSGWNEALFGRIEGIVKHTPGRFFEFLPLAVCGLLLAKFADVWTKARRRTLLVALAALVVSGLMMFVGFPGMPPGFAYQGFAPFLMCASLCMLLTVVGDGLPCLQGRFARALCYLSLLTPGIYYSHMAIGSFVWWALGWEQGHLLSLAVVLGSGLAVAGCLRLKGLAWIVR